MTRNKCGSLVNQFIGCWAHHEEVDVSNSTHSASCVLDTLSHSLVLVQSSKYPNMTVLSADDKSRH